MKNTVVKKGFWVCWTVVFGAGGLWAGINAVRDGNESFPCLLVLVWLALSFITYALTPPSSTFRSCNFWSLPILLLPLFLWFSDQTGYWIINDQPPMAIIDTITSLAFKSPWQHPIDFWPEKIAVKTRQEVPVSSGNFTADVTVKFKINPTAPEFWDYFNPTKDIRTQLDPLVAPVVAKILNWSADELKNLRSVSLVYPDSEVLPAGISIDGLIQVSDIKLTLRAAESP